MGVDIKPGPALAVDLRLSITKAAPAMSNAVAIRPHVPTPGTDAPVAILKAGLLVADVTPDAEKVSTLSVPS